MWNSLSESVMTAGSINSFKNHLHKYWVKYKVDENPQRIQTHYDTDISRPTLDSQQAKKPTVTESDIDIDIDKCNADKSI